MKKILLGTIALLAVSAAAHAEPTKGLKLGIGGYFTAQGAYADQDNASGEPAFRVRNTDILQHSEVHFNGETTFDSGLTAGAEIVLKGEPENEQIQESYAYMSGNWGRVEVGANYSAAYQLTVAVPGVDAQNYDGPDPDFLLAEPGTNVASEGYVPFYRSGGLLSEKLTYYTPRFNGFQAGVSYTPDAERNGSPIGENSITGNTGNGGNTFKGPATAGLGGSDNPGEESNRLEAGINYQGHLYGMGVLAGTTYGHADVEAPLGAFTNATDENAWNAGIQLSYQNFTFGGGYYWDTNAFTNSTLAGADVADNETNTWYAGVNYGKGPWLVGASYLNSHIDTAVAGTADAVKDELDRWILGGNYEVAPGVKFTSTLQFHEYDRSEGAIAAVDATGSNDATIVTVGTTVNF